MEILKALVVEDTRSMRKIIKQGLEKDFRQIVVDEAENGKEAQQKLTVGSYNIILCDLDMPVMNGEELLIWIKSRPTLKDIPFIMITATRERDHVMRVIKLGAKGYLVKPFTMDALTQKIIDVTMNVNRRQHERVEIDGSVQIKHNAGVSGGNILDISKGGMLGSFSSKGPIPRILEMVDLQISIAQGPSLNGLKAYVVRIQAEGETIDTDSIKIAVRFQEGKPESQGALDKYLDSMN
jgi:two-component system chemotaxis response regulator CheY